MHGGSVGDDEDLEVGFERWRKALDSFEQTVPILVEIGERGIVKHGRRCILGPGGHRSQNHRRSRNTTVGSVTADVSSLSSEFTRARTVCMGGS